MYGVSEGIGSEEFGCIEVRVVHVRGNGAASPGELLVGIVANAGLGIVGGRVVVAL